MILAEIAETLWEGRRQLDPSLAGGLAGAALFLAYLSLRPGWEHQRSRSREMLALAIGGAQRVNGPGLYSGYSGLAWCVEHLRKRVFTEELEDPNTEVDDALLEGLASGDGAADYDLVKGLVGLGVYGLERLPVAGRPLLLAVLGQLEARGVAHGPGLTWPTLAADLPPVQSERYPHQYLDYGVAHGIPGVLAVVAGMRAFGIEPARCARLLQGGMATLLWLSDPVAGLLPNWCSLDPEPGAPAPGRIAWCYGGLGASIALRQVAVGAGFPDWEAFARNLARQAALRPLEASGVKDAGLCHGAAGNAHLFNRWFQHTGEAEFEAAALAYLAQTLAFRDSGAGCAGFTAFTLDPGREGGTFMRPCPGLLEGAAGIGLALLSFLGGAPDWDCFLLASAPPVPGCPR